MTDSVQMPFADEAEISVLGGMLIDNDAVGRATGVVDETMFYREKNRRVFSCMLRLYNVGTIVDPVTVGEELQKTQELESVGGLPYLATLLDAVPTAANIEFHAKIVRDRALRRRLIETGRQIAEDALGSEKVETAELIDRAEERIMSVASRINIGEGPMRVQSVLWDALELIDKGGIPGVMSGLVELDDKTGGFRAGTLTIIAGAPSMGKSSLALQIAAHASIEHKVSTVIYSVEMTNRDNTIRLFGIEGMLDVSLMMKGKLPDHDFPMLQNAVARVNEAALHLDDNATRVLEMRSRSRRLKGEHNIGLIVVDHIHDMEDDAESRREQVGNIGRGLKRLAKELDVPVIAAAQLSRAPTTRTDHRPMLSDLRESGDLEAVADLVIMLYRPEYYFGPTMTRKGKGKGAGEYEEDIRGKAEAIIAKNRNGPTGRVPLYFRDYCARFETSTKGDK